MNLKKLLIFNLVLFCMGVMGAGYSLIVTPKPLSGEKIEAVNSKLTNSKDIEFLRKSALSLHRLVVTGDQDTGSIAHLFQIGLIAMSIGYATNAGYIFFLLKKRE